MNKCNLILHCGAESVERGQVDAVIAPPSTETYAPLPHGQFIDRVTHGLRQVGYEITNEAHALTKEGSRYFGLFQIEPAVESLTPLVAADYSLVLGLRNSHDKSIPAGLVLGATVFVCDNLSFSGEIKTVRRHTKFIDRDLGPLIDGACGQLAERYAANGRRFEAYKSVELGDKDAHDLIIRAIDCGVIPGSQVANVLTQYRTPNHPEFAEARNVWRLYNAFTEVAKESSIFTLPKRTQALHGILDETVGVLALSN